MKTTTKTNIVFILAIIGYWILNYLVHLYNSINFDYEIYTGLTVTVILIVLSVIMNYVLVKKDKLTQTLKQNEQKLEEIIENSNEWIWELDKNGVIVSSSKMVENILGYKDDEIINKSVYSDFFTPKFKRIANGQFKRQRRFVDVISENITKDGKSVWLKHSGIPLYDRQNVFIGYRGRSKDFSEQKIAKDSLTSLSKTFSAVSGEEFMYKMCEHLSSVLDVDYVFVGELSNSKQSVSIIAGVGKSEKITPFDYLLQDTPCANVVGNEICCYPKNVQELFPKDKLLIDMGIESYLGAPIFDKEGNATGILVVLNSKPIDNSEMASTLFNIFLERTSAEIERIKSQRALAKSEKTFRNLFNNSPVGMFQSSIDGQTMYNCNSQFCSLVGYSEFELKKHTSDQIWIKPHKRKKMIDLILSDQSVKYFEAELLTKKGDLIFVSISIAVYKEEQYIEGTVDDITEAKLFEETRKAILKLNSEFADLSIEQIFANGLDQIKDISQSETIFYYLVDENDTALPKFISINNKTGFTCSEENIHDFIDKKLVEECITAKHPILKNKINANEKTLLQNFSRTLYVPVVENNNVIAIIGMGNKQYNYSILEADQLTMLAENIWNIAAKKRIEQQIKTSERNFRTFFDSVDSFITIIDFEGKIIAVNDTLIEKLEYKKKQLVGENITILHPVKRIEEVKVIFDQAVAGERKSCNIPVVSKNNVEIEVETTASIGFWNGQKVIFAVSKDVSLLRNSELLLEISENNLKTFFDSVDNMLFVLDGVGNIISVNMSGLKKLGYQEDEIIGKSLLSLYDPLQKREAIQFFTGMIEGKKESCTLPFIAKNGTVIPVEIKVKSGIWSGESVMFGVANDLSLIKESEEKFSTAFHNSSVIMAIHLVSTGEFYDINNTFTEIFGYSRDEVLGKTVKGLGLLVDANSLIDLNIELKKKGNIRNYIQEFYTKDNKIKIGSVSINIVSLHGELYELVAVNDITELKEKEFRLAESELNLKKAQTVSKLGSWDWNINENQIYCSEEAYNIFDIDKNIIPNIEMIIDSIYPEDKTIFSDALKLAYSGNALESIEIRIKTKQGVVKSIRILTELDGTSTPNPTRFFGTVQDLTLLKEAQLALIESEGQFRSLAESSYDAIMRYNREYRYLYVNKAVVNLTGLKFGDIIGKTNRELGVPNKLVSYWENGLKKVFETGVYEPQVFEWVSNGNTVTFDGRMYPEFDETGKVKSVLCVSRDITEKKLVEKELEEYRIHLEKLVEQRTNELTEANKNLEIEMKKFEESEEKFRALAENAEDTIMRFDRSLKHMYVNPVVEAQTGINALEFIGKTHEELGFPENLSELWEKELISVFNSGKSDRTEFMLPNGVWIDWSILPEFDDEGEVASVVTVGHDITDRKNMELKVEEALKKEKELNELKSKFISTTSHEFRTPLTAIMSSTELLERYGRRWEENKYNEHIGRIIKSVEHLTDLMDDILTISRAESGRLKYEPAEMDLYQLFLDIIADVGVLRTPSHNLNFNYNINEKVFVFDKKLLSMVFLNLLSNSLKYSPNGGTIDININRDNSIIQIEISDEGIGIPENDLDSLFEAFYRAENVSEMPGTGLGLSIVKTSVELHNGSISVKSKENEGTKVNIRLPILA